VGLGKLEIAEMEIAEISKKKVVKKIRQRRLICTPPESQRSPPGVTTLDETLIVGDLVSTACHVSIASHVTHAIVNQTDEFLTHNSGLVNQLAVAAGEEMSNECATYITAHGRLSVAFSQNDNPHCRAKRCRLSV
jgi:hypothetical protein